MYVTLFVLWGVTMAWFNPRLISLFSEAQSVPAGIALALFILSLDAFWLFGNYFVVITAFSFFAGSRISAPSTSSEQEPRVAILYLTRNDLQDEALQSCLHQDYGNFHVFILDDSTDGSYMAAVDRIGQRFPERVTVIRRLDRKGFKAGAINSAVRDHIGDFPYLAIVDADGVIPTDFTRRLLPYFQADDSIAFVQASHAPNPAQKSKFAGDLGLGVLPLWTTFMPPRNKFGLVVFLGHGGIVRRDVWELAGGFPELISEDLAFSTRVRELGFQGVFAADVECLEDFPETYGQLRKQQEKYIRGGCQYLLSQHFRAFLRSPRPKWFEKVDLVIWCSTLFLPAFYLFFLVLFAAVLPLAFSEPRTLHIDLLGIDVRLWRAYPLEDSFHSIWKWDFYLVTVVMMFAPVLGCLRFALKFPWKTIRVLFCSTVPYLSMMVVSVVAFITFILTKAVEWPVTGDRIGSPVTQDETTHQRGTTRSWLSRLNSTHGAVFGADWMAGLLLTLACLVTLNLGLLAFSLSLMLAPLVYRTRWENKALALVMPVPFLMILISMSTLGLNVLGMQGAFYVFFPAHF